MTTLFPAGRVAPHVGQFPPPIALIDPKFRWVWTSKCQVMIVPFIQQGGDPTMLFGKFEGQTLSPVNAADSSYRMTERGLGLLQEVDESWTLNWGAFPPSSPEVTFYLMMSGCVFNPSVAFIFGGLRSGFQRTKTSIIARDTGGFAFRVSDDDTADTFTQTPFVDVADPGSYQVIATFMNGYPARIRVYDLYGNLQGSAETIALAHNAFWANLFYTNGQNAGISRTVTHDLVAGYVVEHSITDQQCDELALDPFGPFTVMVPEVGKAGAAVALGAKTSLAGKMAGIGSL